MGTILFEIPLILTFNSLNIKAFLFSKDFLKIEQDAPVSNNATTHLLFKISLKFKPQYLAFCRFIEKL